MIRTLEWNSLVVRLSPERGVTYRSLQTPVFAVFVSRVALLIKHEKIHMQHPHPLDA